MNHDKMMNMPTGGNNVMAQSSQSPTGMMDMTAAGGGMDSSAMMMKMYFHFSSHATILFAGWATTTPAQMFGSCLLMVLVAAMYEGLKVLRDWLLRRAAQVPESQRGCCNDSSIRAEENERTKDVKENDLSESAKPPKQQAAKHLKLIRCQMLSLAHFIQTLLHIIQVAISYALMLVFMTFNAWLCLSILAGAGIGYFLFAWKRTTITDANEHCN
jgi:copper transporter 1